MRGEGEGEERGRWSAGAAGGHDFDVIVVGAGPAGSTAAWKLAGAGVDVLLVDGSEFPRSKPCGEAVSPGATPLLEEMGVLERLRSEGAATLRGFRLRTPEGRFITAGFGPVRDGIPSEALALSRRRFDAVLLDAAMAAGAEFRAPLRVFDVAIPDADGNDRAGGSNADGLGSLGYGPDERLRPRAREPAEPVRLRARDGNGRKVALRARWVIGADGLRSVVARRTVGVRRGRRDRLAVVGRYVPVDDESPPSDFGELRVSDHGVLGVAPIENGLCTVAVVVERGRAGEVSPGPFAFYRAEVEAYGFPPPESEDALAGPLEVTGPFEITPRAVSAPGVLLAGDAAGYFDPFTGQGIYRALMTGRHAADAVEVALADPQRADEARGRYERQLAQLLVPGRRVQKLVDAVVSRPSLINPAGRLMARRPGLLSLLLDVTGDRVSPGRLLSPSALMAAWREGGVERRTVAEG